MNQIRFPLRYNWQSHHHHAILNSSSMMMSSSSHNEGHLEPVTTYHLPGLSLSFALPYFGTLLVIELIVALCQYYSRRRKNRQKMMNKCNGSSSSSANSGSEGFIGENQLRNESLLFRWNDSFSSLCCGIMQQMLDKVFTKYVELIFYCGVYHYWRLWTITDTNQTHVSSVYWWLALLIGDHQYYWLHRFLHECNMGWATHAPHHSSEEYNLVTALRQGALQHVFSMAFFLPMALLGISPELYAIQGEISLLYQYWIHTRVVVRFPRIIEYVFNTPSHHRVHHGRNAEYIDKNYGGIFIVFDRLFKTFEAEGNTVVYGLVHPLQTFNPIRSQLHHWIDMITLARSLPTWKQSIQVFVRGPGFNPVDGTNYPIPDTPPIDKLRKYDPKIPSHATVYGFVHFLSLFVSALLFVTIPQTGYVHTLCQFIMLSFGFYNVSLLFDGYFTDFCWYERIRFLLLVPVFLLNMFTRTRGYVSHFSYHIPEQLLRVQKVSNMVTVFCLLSALYVATRISKLKDIPRPEPQNWEKEKLSELTSKKHD